MDSYNKQYNVEQELFGAPYPEFEQFVASVAVKGGKALDVGCGQGRDALMLARHGYGVTGIDSSEVGINQLTKKAQKEGLPINGIVADFYDYKFVEQYDLIVLDSILHFEKNDREKEIQLLDTLSQHLTNNGILIIFIHKSAKKEKVLNGWIETNKSRFNLTSSGYIDYVYQEKSSGFKSAFQMCMNVLQHKVYRN
ncbi:MAG: class I SAM-dependent methyltransferase [Anaerolineae bacterium]